MASISFQHSLCVVPWRIHPRPPNSSDNSTLAASWKKRTQWSTPSTSPLKFEEKQTFIMRMCPVLCQRQKTHTHSLAFPFKGCFYIIFSSVIILYDGIKMKKQIISPTIGRMFSTFIPAEEPHWEPLWASVYMTITSPKYIQKQYIWIMNMCVCDTNKTQHNPTTKRQTLPLTTLHWCFLEAKVKNKNDLYIHTCMWLFIYVDNW